MNLIEQISFHKEKLAKVKSQIPYLESVIADLEYRLQSEKINNPVACLNPIQLIDKGCNGCQFEDRCSYQGKGRKFKL